MRIRGVNSVDEALKAGKVSKIYIKAGAKSKRVAEIASRAKKIGIPVYTVKKLDSNVEADISPIIYVELDVLIENALRERGFLLLLDSIQDVQNLGSILRSAVFFGCSGVIIPKRRSVQINEGVIRASAGSAIHARVSRVANLANTLKLLKKMGFHTVCAETEGKPIHEAFLDPPLVIVGGGEDRGVSNPVKKQCDEIVSVKKYGEIDSLNVSNALAIFMYEFRRRLL